MITIKKSESIELYQLKLTLKEKVKQNPFIAVLMLAQELFENDSEYINSEIFLSIINLYYICIFGRH